MACLVRDCVALPTLNGLSTGFAMTDGVAVYASGPAEPYAASTWCRGLLYAHDLRHAGRGSVALDGPRTFPPFAILRRRRDLVVAAMRAKSTRRLHSSRTGVYVFPIARANRPSHAPGKTLAPTSTSAFFPL